MQVVPSPERSDLYDSYGCRNEGFLTINLLYFCYQINTPLLQPRIRLIQTRNTLLRYDVPMPIARSGVCFSGDLYSDGWGGSIPGDAAWARPGLAVFYDGQQDGSSHCGAPPCQIGVISRLNLQAQAVKKVFLLRRAKCR
jgi:hypothetical protein